MEIVRIDIVDNDLLPFENDGNKIMDTFYLVNPDKNKLNELQKMMNERFDSDWWNGDYFPIQYINENFEVFNIKENICLEW